MKKSYNTPVIKQFGKVIYNTLGSNVRGTDADGTKNVMNP